MPSNQAKRLYGGYRRPADDLEEQQWRECRRHLATLPPWLTKNEGEQGRAEGGQHEDRHKPNRRKDSRRPDLVPIDASSIVDPRGEVRKGNDADRLTHEHDWCRRDRLRQCDEASLMQANEARHEE